MDLFEQVSNDIKEAMKARDKVRLMTLRNIKKVFLEAKTAPGANDTLDDAAALKILQKLAKQGRETAATYTAKVAPTWLKKSWPRPPSSRAICPSSSAPQK